MGTLKKIDSNKVESSEGFVFQILNTEYCRYEEEGFFLETQWFYDSKKKFFYIDKSTIHTWKFPANKIMTSEEIIRVNANIDRALLFLCNELHLAY